MTGNKPEVVVVVPANTAGLLYTKASGPEGFLVTPTLDNFSASEQWGTLQLSRSSKANPWALT